MSNNEYQKKWNAANPARAKLNNLKSVAKRNGHAPPQITVDELEARLALHDGKCDICGSDKKLDLDHCHYTGAVRGFLCRNCNLGIGYLGEDLNRVAKAAAYLAR